MTPSERQWLQDARRTIRYALRQVMVDDWDAAIANAKGVVRSTIVTDCTLEVTHLLASFAHSNPTDYRANAAMRAAAIRRLKETKDYIGKTLAATTGR
jgi:hypothetical protein